MRLITIIGPSGAGKDTVAKMLSYCLGYDVLCSYTTRPMREGETDGVEHHFVKECNVPDEDMLAYSMYGDKEYWTLKSDVKGTAIYVIDEKGFLKLCETVPDAEFIAIYVSAKPETLQKRGIDSKRMDRDVYRVKMDINNYDFVIPNNGTQSELWEFVNVVAHRIKEHITSTFRNKL